MSKSKTLQVKAAPLHLDGYFIKKLLFSISSDMENESLSSLVMRGGYHPQFEELTLESSLKFDLGFSVSNNEEEPNSYKFALNVKSAKQKDVKQVYDFEVEIVAYFTWKLEQEIPNLDNRIQTTAIGLMYASAREALASATARSPFPALVLPSTWFNFSSEEDSQNETKQPSKKPKISPKPKKKAAKESKES
jgi:preprotein translocase subunit SecB